MRLEQVRPGRARLAMLACAGFVSTTVGVTLSAPASAQTTQRTQSTQGAHGAHAGHAAPAAPAAQPANCRRWTAPTGEPERVRSSTDSLVGFRLAFIRKGVEVMQKRADTDPTSWIYQANMHGTNDDRNLPGWNSCQHESYMFLSWHRMYLYFFERILRRASGDDTLTLPYWNYTDPAKRALPAPYRSPASATNSLYVAQRAPGINTGCQLEADDVSYDNAFAMIAFSAQNPPHHNGWEVNQSFGGAIVSGSTHAGILPSQFEHQPHDLIHNVVGGPDGYMSAVETSAQDPIFWAHHANIDRLWSKWIALGGGRADPPSSDTVWNDLQFTFFDENGQCVLMTGREVIDTARQLNYRYDDDPPSAPTSREMTRNEIRTNGSTPAAAETAVQLLAESGGGPVQLSGRRRAVPVEIKPESRAAVRALAQGGTATPSRVFLQLAHFDYSPGAYYKLYLNLPDADAQPSSQSPHYIGLIAPFSTRARPGDPEGLTLSFDLTPVIQKLTAEKRWTGEALTVTFVPRDFCAQPPEKADTAAQQSKSQTPPIVSGNARMTGLRILSTP